MTTDDLTTLRDEVAEVCERVTPDESDALHVRYRDGYDEDCPTCVRIRREGYETADALLPLLGRVRDEGRAEALREAAGALDVMKPPATMRGGCRISWAAAMDDAADDLRDRAARIAREPDTDRPDTAGEEKP